MSESNTPNADLLAAIVQEVYLPVGMAKLASVGLPPESEELATRALVLGSQVVNAIEKSAATRQNPIEAAFAQHEAKVASIINSDVPQQKPDLVATAATSALQSEHLNSLFSKVIG